MITTREEDRQIGLVYLNEELKHLPATHVLAIGVGDYKSAKLKPLTSPPISVRAVADWFLRGALDPTASGSFRNPHRQLASLALVLSEAAEDPPRLKLPSRCMRVRQCPVRVLKTHSGLSTPG